MTFFYDVSSSFTRLPGGRKIEHGPDSGEKFLLAVLVPFWNRYDRTQEKVFFEFAACMGVTNGFLDESFGELANIFGAEAVRLRFEVKGLSDRKDYDGMLNRAGKNGNLEYPQHLQAKATREQRDHVTAFMDWCAQQDPPLHLAQNEEDHRHYGSVNVDWKPWCTKWCGVDEEAFSAEKDQMVSKMREQNDLFERSRKYCQKHKVKPPEL